MKYRKYFMESQPYDADSSQTEFVIFECFGEQNYIFRCHGKSNAECVSQFEKAKIFGGLTGDRGTGAFGSTGE